MRAGKAYQRRPSIWNWIKGSFCTSFIVFARFVTYSIILNFLTFLNSSNEIFASNSLSALKRVLFQAVVKPHIVEVGPDYHLKDGEKFANSNFSVVVRMTNLESESKLLFLICTGWQALKSLVKLEEMRFCLLYFCQEPQWHALL